MLDYRFYSDEYGGTAIPGREWPEFERDADAQLRRYERIYTVSYETDDARPMAVCAIADAMYAYAQLDAGNGAVQSVSIGSERKPRRSACAGHQPGSTGSRVLSLYAAVCNHLQGVLICSSITQGISPCAIRIATGQLLFTIQCSILFRAAVWYCRACTMRHARM